MSEQNLKQWALLRAFIIPILLAGLLQFLKSEKCILRKGFILRLNNQLGLQQRIRWVQKLMREIQPSLFIPRMLQKSFLKYTMRLTEKMQNMIIGLLKIRAMIFGGQNFQATLPVNIMRSAAGAKTGRSPNLGSAETVRPVL